MQSDKDLASCGSKRLLPPQPESTTFIIQTPHGLEHVAIHEMQQAFSSHIKSVTPLPSSNGIIILRLGIPATPSLANSMARLACADAVAVFCGQYTDLALDETAIETLKTAALGFDWDSRWRNEYAPLLQHDVHRKPTFRCTCSRTAQMADWGYNSIGSCSAAAEPDPALVFARCSDVTVSQLRSHVSSLPPRML
jgi:hypothetical protein